MKLLKSMQVFYVLLVLLLSGSISLAQENGQNSNTENSANTITTTTSTTTTETWYAQPWVWIVGGAVLLLLLVALLRGGGSDSRTDRVTITKTVDREAV